MKKNIKGVGVPIYTPQGNFVGYITVNRKLEVSHSLQFGYSIDRKEAEIKKLNREINGLKRDIIHANNNYHSNLTKIMNLKKWKCIPLTISTIALTILLLHIAAGRMI